MDFKNVTQWFIPEGEVKSLTINGVKVWEKVSNPFAEFVPDISLNALNQIVINNRTTLNALILNKNVEVGIILKRKSHSIRNSTGKWGLGNSYSCSWKHMQIYQKNRLHCNFSYNKNTGVIVDSEKVINNLYPTTGRYFYGMRSELYHKYNFIGVIFRLSEDNYCKKSSKSVKLSRTTQPEVVMGYTFT